MSEQSVLIIQCIGDGNLILDWIQGRDDYCDVPGWVLVGMGIRGLKVGQEFNLLVGDKDMIFRKIHARLDYTRIQWTGKEA